MKLSELGYISNILSLTRLLLAIPIYYFLSWQTMAGNYLAVAVMILAALTDAYDGRLARKLRQKSDLGRLLDPIADKICLGIIIIVLVQTRDLPLWFVILALSRDLAILLLGFVMTIRTKKVVESNMLGKVTVNFLALTVVVYALDLEAAKIPALWASVAMLIASSVSYFIELLKSAVSPESSSTSS